MTSSTRVRSPTVAALAPEWRPAPHPGWSSATRVRFPEVDQPQPHSSAVERLRVVFLTAAGLACPRRPVTDKSAKHTTHIYGARISGGGAARLSNGDNPLEITTAIELDGC